MPVKTLRNNPIRTFNGSGTIRVFHPNHGMHSGSDNVIIAGVLRYLQWYCTFRY